MSSRRCPASGWDAREWRPIYRKGVYLSLCLLTHGNLAVPQTIRQKQSNGRCSWVCNIRLFIADSHCWLLLMLTYINIRRGLRRCSSRRIGRCQSLHVWDEWLWDSHAFFVYQPYFWFGKRQKRELLGNDSTMDKQVKNNLGYHYTSLSSFMAILKGVKDGNILFHASDVYYMNDPTEIEYGLNEISKCFADIENTLHLNFAEYQLSKLWDKDCLVLK